MPAEHRGAVNVHIQSLHETTQTDTDITAVGR